MNISVVIPAYNEEKFIARCLSSLQKQTKKPFEIILVDAQSTDKTTSIAKSYLATIVPTKKIGISHARDVGFNRARGEIIARCDADTLVPPDWIEKIENNFKTKTIDALAGPIIYYDLPLKTTLYSKVFIHLMHLTLHHYILIGNNMAITKKVWNRVKNQTCTDDTKMHEDIDLSMHLAKLGAKIHYDPQFIAYTSGRRIIGNPRSFFIEYPLRLKQMLQDH